MEITEAAMARIRERVSSSRSPDPVVQLCQCTAGKKVPAEIGKAILEGAPEATIRELSLRLMGDSRNEPLYLEAYAQSRKTMPLLCRLFFKTIRGFVFFAPPGLRAKMKHGVLDIAVRGFVLKDQNGNVLLPGSMRRTAHHDGEMT
jgi:hypothetical protein